MSNSVHWLRHASPYINAHKGCTFVLMLPGEALECEAFTHILHDLVLLHSLGVRLVLVYGARMQIAQRLAERGLVESYQGELRITDSAALTAVIEAVGVLRTALEARLSMDMAASPMQGARLRVVSGNLVTAKPIGVVDGIDYQHTGEVRRIDRKGINRLLDERTLVLLPPLGTSPTGEVFNLSCEEVATQTAIALGADKLLLLGSATGILDEKGELLRELTPAQGDRELARLGVESEAGGLLAAALTACRGGVGRSHIISYRQDSTLLTELFTRLGSGTLITKEQMESLRLASIDDVGGLLELIAPLEEKGILLRRSREMLEQEVGRFSLIERDGLIIACAGLYPIEDTDCGELTCLAVHSDYRHESRGDQLLAHIESRARSQGIKTLFVLTTRTAHWFLERGFLQSSVERLPRARASLYNYQRGSKVFEKSL